jgi:hypothetical protein
LNFVEAASEVHWQVAKRIFWLGLWGWWRRVGQTGCRIREAGAVAGIGAAEIIALHRVIVACGGERYTKKKG